MSSQPGHSWIPLEKVDAAISPESALILLALILGAWLTYIFFLKKVTPQRHRRLRGLFRNLLLHTLFAATLCMLYYCVHELTDEASPVRRLEPSIGLFTLIWGAIVFVKTCRIFAFEYLFLINMRAGVPVLLVNLFSLLLSAVIGFWMMTGIFEFNLAPLLATSAVFSIVLGLALQDTLGNLFAGVALQLDKPYEIGDWIEVTTSSQKWVGQVTEISWRATILAAFTDEVISIPNRVMSQAELSNYAGKVRPFTRGHIFRLPFGCSPIQVKELLLQSLEGVPGVLTEPAPLVLVLDQTDAWVQFKLIYYIRDFGTQYRIGDTVITKALEILRDAGITLASQRISVLLPQPASATPSPSASAT